MKGLKEQMVKRYVVKNCPSIYRGYRTEYDCDYDGPCQDCTDCLIKQVVEKCREELGIRYNDIDQGRNYLANELLQLFTIEEITQ